MISIVIPCYNGEEYIEQCYKSLCTQSLMDWEAVFIDDGSKDGSSIALDNLVLRDNRVKVIHKQNEGVRRCGFRAVFRHHETDDADRLSHIVANAACLGT